MGWPVREEGCSFPDCDRPYSARGYCESHYSQWRRHGEVKPLKLLPPLGERLRQRSSANPSSGCRVWTGSATNAGYGVSTRMVSYIRRRESWKWLEAV